MEDNREYDNSLQSKVINETERIIKDVMSDGINPNNIDFFGKVIDVHKDMSDEEYWKAKEESFMRYGRGYGRERYVDDSFGRRSRDSRGRYTEGRRDRRYRGHDYIDEIYDHYGDYSESKEDRRRGRYGAKEDSMKSLECMLESMVDFVEMLKEDAESQEEVALIQEYTRKISEM